LRVPFSCVHFLCRNMDKSYRISLCSTREHAPCIDSDDTVNVENVCFLELLDA